VFVTIWNDFLLSFSLTLKDEHRLLQTGLYLFVNESGIEWGPLMAAAIGSMIPVALAFALLQRSFIRGLTGGAVKG
jgi:ABC-type glycerol-3-phosphate transport system permease component